MPASNCLIGDIGGTNARFALADTAGVGIHDVLTLRCADFPAATDAIRHYLDAVSVTNLDAMCLAVAGPVTDVVVRITNNHWCLRADDLSEAFDIGAVRFLNDFEAVAWSIPQLAADDYETIASESPWTLPEGDFRIAIIGPGTGLGTAGLYRYGSSPVPIVGEGGHVGFAPNSALQTDILKVLQGEFGRVILEKLVSGPGAENLYKALAVVRGQTRAVLSAAQIFEAAVDGSDPLATEAAQLFFEILGQAAGDLALTLGASDGVFIAGGIARRYPEQLRASAFRAAFESKGDYRQLMESVPTLLITHDEPGLLGAAYCALDSLPS